MENIQKIQVKKHDKSYKSFSRIFLDQNPFFCNFKNGQKSIFELGKSLKLPKMQFHEIFYVIVIKKYQFIS